VSAADKALPSTDAPASCGETTVYVAGFALSATCVEGIITDTFATGFRCPHHDPD
jgi:hypothetical protein